MGTKQVAAVRPEDKGLLRGLNVLWLELTLQCNLKCVHCYADSGPEIGKEEEILTFDDWTNIIKEARSLGLQHLILIGGEVTLNREILPIIDFSVEQGIPDIEVYTNLTTFTPKLLSQYAERDIRIATSFYSHKAEIHEAITQIPGSHARTLENIKTALSLGIPLSVGVISMPTNEETIQETIDFLAELGVPKEAIGLDRVRGVGRGGSFIEESGIDALCGACWEGALCVSPDGSTIPCIFARDTVIDNVKSATLRDIVNSSALRQFREEVYVMDMQQREDGEGCNPQCPPGPCEPACFPRQGCPPTKR